MNATARLKLAVFSVLMVLITFSQPLAVFDVGGVLGDQLNRLPMAGLAVLLTLVFAPRVRLGYLSPRRTGTMSPLVGRGEEGRWETDGWLVGLLLSAVMGAWALMAVLPEGLRVTWLSVLLVIPFAASNALIEELTFRLPYVTIGDALTDSRWYGLIMGSLVFGVSHYWGVMPNGILGALASAFLGYVLVKSMQETRGFFWAFTIHFMIDAVIMFFLFSAG